MAKFKKVRRYGRKVFAKRSSRKSSSSMSPLMTIGTSAAYAVARPYAANMIPDFLPGQAAPYTDSAVLGGLGALAAWKGKGTIKKVGMVVLANESFIAASKLSQSMTTPTQTGNTFTYG